MRKNKGRTSLGVDLPAMGATDSSRESAELVVAERLLHELQDVRRIGWWEFRARDFPVLAGLCRPAGRGESPELPIQQRLLDLMDPEPVDSLGRKQRRPDLGSRPLHDKGLLARVMFGEPSTIQFSPGPKGEDLTVHPRALKLTARYRLLEALRNEGKQTINQPSKAGRRKPGAGHQVMLDLRDALLIDAGSEIVRPAEPHAMPEDIEMDTPAVPLATNELITPESDDASPPGQEAGRGAMRRRLALALATVALVGVGACSYFVIAGGKSAKSVGELRGSPLSAQSAMAVSANGQLAAGLRLANRSYDKKWGTRIRADPRDTVAFALTVRNLSGVRTPPAVAWTESQADPELIRGQEVRVLLADRAGNIMVRTPWVHAQGWSDQFGSFDVGLYKALISDASGRRVRNVPPLGSAVMPVQLRTLPFPTAVAVPIGRLDPHQVIVVRATASWKLLNQSIYPDEALAFGTIPPTFEVRGAHQTNPLETVSANIGDIIKVSIFLRNPGTIAGDAHIRVELQPRRGGQFYRVVVFGRLGPVGFREQRIGTGSINSAEAVPIKIVPQPGSTQLRSHHYGSAVYDAKCPNDRFPTKRALSDGITLAGVDIGDFGGFTPHTNCAGSEFDEYILFNASVAAR